MTSPLICSFSLPVQAYGYKNYKRVGIVFQRGILILGLAMCPIWALWLNAESILLLVQQTPCVARLVFLQCGNSTNSNALIYFSLSCCTA